MAISIDWGTKVIYVPQSFLTFVVGSNYSLDTNAFHIALRGLEDDEGGVTNLPTHRHNTTVLMGGLEYARIIEIINGYTITFENGAYSVSLLGSNNNILDVTNLNQVSVRSNNSAGLVSLPQITQSTEMTKRLVENLRPHHTGTGTMFYWDPINGSDSYDGLLPWTACATFAHIHDNLVTDYGHDIISCVSNTVSPATVTTAEESIVISKNFVFVRGPGRDFEIDTTTLGGLGVDITGKGVELSGVRIKTGLLGTDDAIDISGDFCYIKNVWVEQCGASAVHITTSANTIIEGGYFKGYKGHGINVGNSVNHLWLRDVNLHGASGNGDGVHIEGTSIFEVKIVGNSDIHANNGWGINVVTPNSRITLGNNVVIESNTAGSINDPNNKVIYEGRLTQEHFAAPSADANAAAVLAAAQTTPIQSDVRKMNNETMIGTGAENNKFRSHLVP